jgi:hypothetical protein
MSISARGRHVLSIMLIVVLATSAPAWTTTDRTTHCRQQTGTCAQGDPCTTADRGERTSLACCDLPAPIPIDRARLPQGAPPPAGESIAALMDHVVAPRDPARPSRITSPHWLRALDLPVLHQSLVI